ncbi:purine-nucleoside phosphorylase [Muriicola soli]|uniref:Uridine phosphorylase n=1 Tax=Muriicola soli TaxID=2507538 RepID=A0A411E6S3_9FLAO|nr:purine-nucleoside phosphorylase [Muriicola soli]QBA63223.1 purine-nucleoside phosphorylase [Muriicola soli]
MSTHIKAGKGDIAETVLLPGDPLRAKWIAETFLDKAVCYNQVRGMLGFTGFFEGKRISVQGSGMGIPSAMIYYHELIKMYGAKKLIRVGTAGSYQKDVGIRDVVLAMSASTTSSINDQRFHSSHFAPTANFELFGKALVYAEANNISIKAGNVLTHDLYYEDDIEDYKKWAEYGVLCVEMETAGLYTIAAKHKVKALSILTISDSLVTGKATSPEEREKSFKEMVEIALNIG